MTLKFTLLKFNLLLELRSNFWDSHLWHVSQEMMDSGHTKAHHGMWLNNGQSAVGSEQCTADQTITVPAYRRHTLSVSGHNRAILFNIAHYE